MRIRVLKCFGGHLRERSADDRAGWLFLHANGDYEYRNPDSVYVHRWGSFDTREAALDWLDNHVPKAEQHEWRLYRAEASA